jgi:16S rRNA (adenine1518-N6/adenine1519-N6)-dimethyltransferase
MRYQPRKRFGQHFLRDRGVIRRIADVIDPRAGETIVEIGPGEGVLSYELLQRAAPLHVVEFDRDLVALLHKNFPPERLIVHQADALRFDFRELAAPGKKLRLVGNLPYNISTPLLFHLLEQLEAIEDMVFMLQKEVVDRLAARPATADYGQLSVLMQWRVAVEPLFEVAPGAFHPPPKVDSTVVRLVPHATAPVQPRDPLVFTSVVKAAFANRRKMLRNNLRELIDTTRLAALGIDPERRAETLTLTEFARIADAIS